MNVSEGHSDTDQLQGSEVAFPPEVFGHARPQSCQTIVHIHHYVDQGVDQTNQKSYGQIHSMSITFRAIR